MPVKIFIFDINGVVISSEMFSSQLEKDYGISRELLHPFFRGVFQKCLIGEADLRKEIIPYYRQWGWRGTLDELLAYWFKVEGTADERIIKLIKQLKKNGKICYAATNQEKYRTDYLANDMGLGKIFDRIFSSACLGCKKPESNFYEKVFSSIIGRTDAKKDEIILIDDDAENIEGAKKFGFNVFQYRDFESFNNSAGLFNN